MPAAETRARECWRCRADAGPTLVCARCEAVQPLAPEADLFTILELPRRLEIDVAGLEARYHAASRAVHPDRYQTAGARERDLSLAASAAVNRAYRTLRDPVMRGRYWLELHGTRLGDQGPQVPPEIAAEVFEAQEKLEELRAAGGGPEAAALRRDVETMHDRFAARLTALSDGLFSDRTAGNGEGPFLDELRRRLSEIAYLRTLVGDIEDAIEGGLRGTDHRH
jgi:molecular chaperone HscB